METIPEFKKDLGTLENKEKLSLRVLVAEDFKPLRENVKEILEIRGYKVEAVENGQLLIDKLLEEGQSYDLIITDNSMPIKNGIQALKEIHSNEKLNKIPVIFMTAGDFDEYMKKILKNLGAVYLAKPFSEEELYDTIDKLTQKG